MSNRRGVHGKSGARHVENERIYAHPLPLICPQVPTTRASISDMMRSLSLISSQDILNPRCEGIFDPITRSVWVLNAKDSMILWRRGFFGKGDLSRSEPSWLSRQIHARQAAKKGELTSEEIREKRRNERKQFKLDRAKAIEDAATEAEAAFVEGREAPTAAIPSGATWKPQLISEDITSTPIAEEVDDEEEDPQNFEHLQLTLPEAFFLTWGLNCLAVFDPEKLEPMTVTRMWDTFQRAHAPLQQSIKHDNAFIVQYVAYHHYRSLGWVVKGGLKFCVDLLLYKRGPVFNHAEFAVVVIPVYESEQDSGGSTNSQSFSWTRLSTLNRVNSQVQKTLILTYVTIPSQTTVSFSTLSSPACLAQYTVREVVLRRFIPARMRD